MNQWVNSKVVNAAKPLKAAHFPFPRAKELFEALSWCVTTQRVETKEGRLKKLIVASAEEIPQSDWDDGVDPLRSKR
jgi:hypothetical protein